MTNATRTLLILFTVLAAATGLHMAFGGRTASKGLAAAVVTFDSTAVDRLVIERPGKSPLELTRDGQAWQVRAESGTAFPAERKAVMTAMGELLSMKVRALATRDAEKFSRFQVDSTGTTVRLFAGGKEKAAVVLGKFNFVSRSEFNTYVRNAASNDVFAVEGFISSTFGREADSWRDREVWKLDEATIRQVELVMPGDSSWAAFRAGNDTWTSVSDTLESVKANALVRQVAAVSAAQFDDGVEPASVTAPVSYQIKVSLDNGTARTLTLVQHPDDGAYYRASADGYPFVFRLSRSAWDSTVLKARRNFLKQ